MELITRNTFISQGNFSDISLGGYKCANKFFKAADRRLNLDETARHQIRASAKPIPTGH